MHVGSCKVLLLTKSGSLSQIHSFSRGVVFIEVRTCSSVVTCVFKCVFRDVRIHSVVCHKIIRRSPSFIIIAIFHVMSDWKLEHVTEILIVIVDSVCLYCKPLLFL